MFNGLISVIVSTYNWPSALSLVLHSLTHQKDSNFEVLIVDDGSTDDTKNTIQKFMYKVDFELKHLWQEDDGFRLSKARNMGIKNAAGDYLIFLDGDCLARPEFVSNHRQLAQENHFVAGNRVLLNEKFSKQILDKQLDVSNRGLAYWLNQRLKGNINRWHSLSYLPTSSNLRTRNALKWRKAKGCNMAFWKQDLININGFEEKFIGWGYEDSDLIIRLMNAGVKRKSGKFSSTVFHIWHREADRSKQQANLEALEITSKSNKTQADIGLNQ